MRHHHNRRYGGDGWGFDFLSLDELLQLQQECVAVHKNNGNPMPPDQIAALADAILKAREQPQELQLKIAGATTYVKVPHGK